MADVFVSYARDDRPRVEQIAKALEARGFSVWWDPELLPGETYAQKIQTVLGSCKAVLVVWSKTSAARPWVLDEAAVGRDRGVLIPILIDAIEAPLGFRQLQAEDLSKWPGPGGEESFNRVVRAIEALSGQQATPAPPTKHAAFSLPPQAQAAIAEVEKKASNLPRIIGGGLIAILLAAGIYQIVSNEGGGGGDVVETGGATTADAAASYGLTTKQIASLEGKQLIETALQTSNIDAIKSGAEGGDALGQTLMCLAYDWGVGLTADQSSARGWCEKARDNGSALAVTLLSSYHRNGLAGFTADQATANEMLTQAAEAGDARGQYELGANYLNGTNGFETNDALALQWTRRAAEQALQSAQFNLAWMYENGRGVTQDYATAVVWYQKLADEGSPIGLRGLGWMHYNGWGVEKDLAKAMDYYKQASEAGDGNATNNLAAMYETGEGVDKNVDEAVRLYRQAIDQGYAEAKTNLKRLGFED